MSKEDLPWRPYSVRRWLRAALIVMGCTVGGGLVGFFGYGALSVQPNPHGTGAAAALLVGIFFGLVTSLAILIRR